jgi:hypothetical protein
MALGRAGTIGRGARGLLRGALAIDGRETPSGGRPADGGRIVIRDFAVALDGTLSGLLCNVSDEAVPDMSVGAGPSTRSFEIPDT